jgi:tRNA 5-methylaminomethyl-2-thiouridine biosynthesis bifunctional protein
MSRIENPSLSWKGENTPYSDGFDDVYYNLSSGIDESRLVFLDGNRLPQRWQDVTQFTIAETGFGTGLNFLSAWKLFEETASPGTRLDFISVEKFPLHKDDLQRALKPWREPLGDTAIERLLHVYPMRIPGFHRRWISDRVTLTLIFDDALRAYKQLDTVIDAWFLDGFSPKRNPLIWQSDLFAEMARLSVDGTTCASYSAAGDVRRGLETVGFDIKRKDGFGHKWHRTEGVFQSYRKKQNPVIPKHITIAGAGLSGAAMTHVLKRRGVDVTVYDPKGIGSGASGNQLGLINPKIEAQDNPRNDAGQSAFSFANHILSDIPDINYRQTGALHLAHDIGKAERLQKIYSSAGWLEPHLQWIEVKDTKNVCGIAMRQDGVFYPDAASVNNQKLLRALVKNVTTERAPETQPIILCTGLALKKYDLPLQPVRGQVTYIQAPAELKCPVMFGSYIAPTPDGLWALGATFQQNNENPDPTDADDATNIHNAQSVIDIQNLQIAGHWANIRTASRDRFPIAGKLPDRADTYVLGALGSHGIQFSFLLAEILACRITNAPMPMGRDALETIDINRFWKKS